jgi:hypothetical protein
MPPQRSRWLRFAQALMEGVTIRQAAVQSAIRKKYGPTVAATITLAYRSKA